jgi:Zn-dependent peptidase ImmA (M78 family)
MKDRLNQRLLVGEAMKELHQVSGTLGVTAEILEEIANRYNISDLTIVLRASEQGLMISPDLKEQVATHLDRSQRGILARYLNSPFKQRTRHT